MGMALSANDNSYVIVKTSVILIKWKRDFWSIKSYNMNRTLLNLRGGTNEKQQNTYNYLYGLSGSGSVCARYGKEEERGGSG